MREAIASNVLDALLHRGSPNSGGEAEKRDEERSLEGHVCLVKNEDVLRSSSQKTEEVMVDIAGPGEVAVDQMQARDNLDHR